MTRIVLFTVLALLIVMGNSASAQSAKDRAGDIKLWRGYCNDPDPDLRTAYIEEAFETRGETIQRICTRQALSSSNSDIRNLGLRAALVQKNTLLFDVSMPPELVKEFEAAEGDKEATAKVNKYYVAQDYKYMLAGLTVRVNSSSINDAQSVWSPLGSLSKKDERYSGSAILIGDTINWTGDMYLANGRTCRMALALTTESTLKGTLQCNDYWAYPIEAQLF